MLSLRNNERHLGTHAQPNMLHFTHRMFEKIMLCTHAPVHCACSCLKQRGSDLTISRIPSDRSKIYSRGQHNYALNICKMHFFSWHTVGLFVTDQFVSIVWRLNIYIHICSLRFCQSFLRMWHLVELAPNSLLDDGKVRSSPHRQVPSCGLVQELYCNSSSCGLTPHIQKEFPLPGKHTRLCHAQNTFFYHTLNVELAMTFRSTKSRTGMQSSLWSTTFESLEHET